MSNKDEMTSKDLQYMNKVFEQMKLDHEKLLTEYYNYKKPDLWLTGIDITLYYKLLSLTKWTYQFLQKSIYPDLQN